MQSQQTKQRRRERKRLEREEKRRSLRSSLPLEAVPRSGDLPETLLEYAKPFVDAIPASASPEELNGRVMFAAVVWNAVVECHGDAFDAFTELVLDMERNVHGTPPAATILLLAKRKMDDFGDDPRILLAAHVETAIVRALLRRGGFHAACSSLRS